MKYILCYSIEGHHCANQDLQLVESFDSVEELDSKVNELLCDPAFISKVTINYAVEVAKTFSYTPKIRITRYERG